MIRRVGNRGKPPVCTLLLPVMLWLIVGCSTPSILTEAFIVSTATTTATTANTPRIINRNHREHTKRTTPSSFSVSPKIETPLSRTNHRALSAFGIDETASTTVFSSLSSQPILDAIGVDPGQALFWCTIVHWILWDKTTTTVALTFDIICIAITLWDGTMRAAVWEL